MMDDAKGFEAMLWEQHAQAEAVFSVLGDYNSAWELAICAAELSAMGRDVTKPDIKNHISGTDVLGDIVSCLDEIVYDEDDSSHAWDRASSAVESVLVADYYGLEFDLGGALIAARRVAPNCEGARQDLLAWAMRLPSTFGRAKVLLLTLAAEPEIHTHMHLVLPFARVEDEAHELRVSTRGDVFVGEDKITPVEFMGNSGLGALLALGRAIRLSEGDEEFPEVQHYTKVQLWNLAMAYKAMMFNLMHVCGEFKSWAWEVIKTRDSLEDILHLGVVNSGDQSFFKIGGDVDTTCSILRGVPGFGDVVREYLWEVDTDFVTNHRWWMDPGEDPFPAHIAPA
jgi:hypothetical protein